MPALGGPALGMQLFFCSTLLIGTTLGLVAFMTARISDRDPSSEAKRQLMEASLAVEESVGAAAATWENQLAKFAQEPQTLSLFLPNGASKGAGDARAIELAHRLSALTTHVLDANSSLLGECGHGIVPDALLRGLAREALSGLRESWTASAVGPKDSQRACLLVAAPVTEATEGGLRGLGVISASFTLDPARLRDLGRTSAQIAVASRGRRASSEGVVVLSATGALLDPAIEEQINRTRARLPMAADLEHSPPLEFSSQGESFLGVALPLKAAEGSAGVLLLVALPRGSTSQTLQRISRSLLLAGGVALCLSLPASFGLARVLSRPLRQFVAAAEDVARGQLDVKLPSTGGEAGALTRAFGSMVAELKARAQLEAVVSGQERRTQEPTVPAAERAGALADGLNVQAVFASRYLVLSVLGEGGMGTVYRVLDKDLDDEVALKLLRPTGDDAQGVTPRSGPTAELLRQEIKLARMVTHTNVVRVHDFGEAEGVRYFTMEYVSGTTLRELLSRRALLDLAPTLQIAKQVCRGLAAVHRAGIVHGDLKPQNVMLMGSGVVKLMDFGVARTRSALSQGEPLAGTPAYMSPEQARGAELDERSDLYSTGVLMFELFTGRCPFVGEDAFETMRMHLDDPTPNPRALRPDLPDALAQIILSCLDKSRLRRPASAADLERLLIRVRV